MKNGFCDKYSHLVDGFVRRASDTEVILCDTPTQVTLLQTSAATGMLQNQTEALLLVVAGSFLVQKNGLGLNMPRYNFDFSKYLTLVDVHPFDTSLNYGVELLDYNKSVNDVSSFLFMAAKTPFNNDSHDLWSKLHRIKVTFS